MKNKIQLLIRVIALNLILIFLSNHTCLCQAADSMECVKINAIIKQMEEWRKGFTIEKFPLKSKNDKATMSSAFLDNKTATYYSSSAILSNEYMSEFGIDDNGKCGYTAYIGPFTKDNIDTEGKKLGKTFLSCVNTANWDISYSSQSYLSMSYKPVDVFISVMKAEIKNSEKYKLIISIFRFTPLK